MCIRDSNNSATHNVVEKLEKKNAAFLTAFLGSLANKEKFLDAQTGTYPNMSALEMSPEERQQLDQETTALSKELSEMLNAKNRIEELEQEFLQLNQMCIRDRSMNYGTNLSQCDAKVSCFMTLDGV